MGYDYDTLYKSTPDALGAPTKRVVDFFATHAPPPRSVLDVGCGQGRDALFLGRLGYRVHGVDLSPHGIADMTKVATAEGLDVTGEVADITTFAPAATYDVVLIDRTLHMLDTAPRHAALRTLLDAVAPDGCVVIIDERSNITGMKQVVADHPADWQTMQEKAGDLILRRAAGGNT